MIRLLILFLALFSQGLSAEVKQVQPWLGVEIDPKALKEGVLVKRVISGAPAERAGFKDGDVLKAIDKEKFNSRETLMTILRNRGVGTTVKVHLNRSGKDEVKELRLEILPDMLDLAKANLLNKPAPAFELQSVSGRKSITNGDFKGKPFILEFWATWCPACRAAGPFIDRWAKANPSIPVIGISDEPSDVISSFVKKEGFTYMQAHDAEAKVQSAYGLGAIPAFVLIDKTGHVVDLTVGGGDYLLGLLKKAESLK